MIDFGLTKKQKDLLLELLSRYLPGKNKKVWVFGSRARGEHRAASDIDLLIEKPAIDSRIRRKLMNAIEESHFPYKVDLVLPEEVYEPYREQVHKEKVIFMVDR